MSSTCYERKYANATEELAEEIYEKRLAGKSWAQIETEYDLSRKTIYKILRRFGYSDFSSQKDVWDRPCLRCGKRVKRPKGQWICAICKAENIEVANGMFQSMIGIV